MFEDVDAAHGSDAISESASDRVLLYAIWSKKLTADRGWAALADRYPKDARFLLFHVNEELTRAPAERKEWSPSVFLDKVTRLLDAAGGRLNPEVRDLLAIAEDELHPLSEADAARLDRIRARASVRGMGDAVAAKKRLSRLASDVVRELHETTKGGRRIGEVIPEAAGGPDWKTAMAGAKGAKTKYDATAKVAPGDVVEHPKFGAGVVLSVEPGRAQIVFESGARKLVCG